jgi:hypothetical protein
VWIFLNEGEKGKPVLAKGSRLEVGGEPLMGSRRVGKMVNGKRVIETIPGSHDRAEQYTKIHFADWDLDGLKDILVGHSAGEFLLYMNKGEKGKPAFELPVSLKPEGDTFPPRPSPYLFDWDGDGNRDLLVGSDRGKVFFYKNVGKNDAPLFGKGELLSAGGKTLTVGTRTRIDIADWNNDGAPDLLVGDFSVQADPKAPRGRSMTGFVWVFLAKKPAKDEGGF